MRPLVVPPGEVQRADCGLKCRWIGGLPFPPDLPLQPGQYTNLNCTPQDTRVSEFLIRITY